MDLTVDLQFPDPTGDKLGVLATEIKDKNLLLHGGQRYELGICEQLKMIKLLKRLKK